MTMSAFMQLLDQKPAAAEGATSYSCQHEEAAKKSLVDLCRSVLVSNLERFPPEAFAILDEEEWDNLIRVRYARTQPQKGKGGLDGRGRMNPAVAEKFMSELEKTIPHLAQSEVADKLVWRDIVEFKFKGGGLSRPRGLMYPWPVLEGLAEEYGKTLLSISQLNSIDKELRTVAFRTISEICEMPMDVSLLKSSGIGKAVKKFIKSCSSNECLSAFDEPISNSNIRETPRTKLEAVLQSWMALAASSGVQMKNSMDDDIPPDVTCLHDLAEARKCKFWRDLYNTLEIYDEKRRSNQGAKMRERRHRLNSVRPKVVTVHLSSSRQNAILDRRHCSSVALGPAKQKIQQLKMEASVTSMRRRPPNQAVKTQPIPSTNSSGNGFGAAVAFAKGQHGAKRKQGSGVKIATVQLSGNKRMRIPDSKKAAANMQRLAKKAGFR